MRTITGQLDAYSSSVWRRDEAADLLGFEFAFEKGRLVTKADEVIAKVSPTLNVEEIWPWPEIFRTGKPSVLEDIREGPDFPWRAHLLAQGVITILDRSDADCRPGGGVDRNSIHPKAPVSARRSGIGAGAGQSGDAGDAVDPPLRAKPPCRR